MLLLLLIMNLTFMTIYCLKFLVSIWLGKEARALLGHHQFADVTFWGDRLMRKNQFSSRSRPNITSGK